MCSLLFYILSFIIKQLMFGKQILNLWKYFLEETTVYLADFWGSRRLEQ